MPRFKMECELCGSTYEALLQVGMSVEKSTCPFCREPGKLVKQIDEPKRSPLHRAF